jgi:hypothetical protein
MAFEDFGWAEFGIGEIEMSTAWHRIAQHSVF